MSAAESADQAEATFYAAFRTGDLKAMAGIWEQAGDVICIHPQGPQLVGYEHVMRSWEQILGDSDGLRIESEVIRRYTDGSLSVHFVNETVSNEHGGGKPVTLLATNAYRRTGSGWRIVLHHASPPPVPRRETFRKPAADGDVTLH